MLRMSSEQAAGRRLLNRRDCLLGISAVLVSFSAIRTILAPQDREAVPMPDCPVDAPSQITIPPANEPGERVIVTGRVFGPDGTTPLPHASIYVYHTDARGYYAANGHVTPPRLHGCLRSDDLGRYEIHTIKPGSYPGMRIPSHIHYKVRALGFREDADEIQFAGDPFLKKGDYDQQANDGTFSRIRPLQKDDDGVQHCVRDFKLQRR